MHDESTELGTISVCVDGSSSSSHPVSEVVVIAADVPCTTLYVSLADRNSAIRSRTLNVLVTKQHVGHLV